MAWRIIGGGCFVGALLLLAGCNENDYPLGTSYTFQPHFYLDKKDNSKGELSLDAAQAEQLDGMLAKYFGSPRTPIVSSKPRYTDDSTELETVSSEDEPVLKELGLDDDTLKAGAILYRQHCLYCHGLSGAGNGPTGQFLNPLPRDFRTGLFKFRSTAKKDGDKVDTSATTLPSRADLVKTLRHGVPTASMPSFHLLSDEALNQLTSYVIHLNIRGMAENNLAKQMSSGGSVSEGDLPELVAKLLKRWKTESVSILQPKPPTGGWDALHAAGKASQWQEGRALYQGVGGCVQCHANDGSSSEILVPDNVTRRNEWGDLNLPRNLLWGVYRGGSRPIDLFYRIKLGIAGSGMPAAADYHAPEPVKPGQPAAPPRPVSDDEIWKIVDYVMSLPQQRVK